MPTSFPLLLAAGDIAPLVAFVVYILLVFGLAWGANRLLSQREFLSEYFLGSRSLGIWAFALTYAATSASGGSFTGFPSKIYSHGWILAVWIASYMVVPICTMGIFGKRINQVARKSGAITVPDVLRDRFNSRALGLTASLLIVFFISFNLVAQFKAGSVILRSLLDDVTLFEDLSRGMDRLVAAAILQGHTWLTDAQGQAIDGGYLVCLIMFGLTVIVYTTYGGFHAVVWTDVMQGIVMVLGVLIMLPLTLIAVGGLGTATREMADMRPPQPVKLCLSAPPDWSEAYRVPSGALLLQESESDELPRIFRTTGSAEIPVGGGECRVPALEIVTAASVERLLHSPDREFLTVSITEIVLQEPYRYGAAEEQRGSYVSGPGPDRESLDGFLPLGVAISFFFMWAISGAGQPQHMVRLMAFRDSQTLRRGIMTVTVYYSLIYFPLVIIFVCSRILLPGLDHEPDNVMPKMVVYLTRTFGVTWLAGLLIAAPFAAVMSTVDSFLLLVSSGIVRDVYQRNINPQIKERSIKRLTYAVTLTVGLIALLGAINPPRFLQDIIVYVGSGLAACFLIPVAAALYWPRSNHQGCLWGMAGGLIAHLSLYVAGAFRNDSFFRPMTLFGLDPVVIGLIASLIATMLGTLYTAPPDPQLVRKYFFKKSEPAAT